MTSFHSTGWLVVGSGAHLVAVYASEAEANQSDFGTANLLDLMRLQTATARINICIICAAL